MIPKRKRCVLTYADKVKIIQLLDEGIPSIKLAKMYNVVGSTIYEIKKYKQYILSRVPVLEGENTKTMKDLEHAIFKSFDRQRVMRKSVSDMKICNTAMRLAKKMKVESFEASTGWLMNFKVRHGIPDFDDKHHDLPGAQTTTMMIEKQAQPEYLNNNNDSKYLHKKFKKMATAVQSIIHPLSALQENQSTSNAVAQTAQSFIIKDPLSNGEVENNVQTNHKDENCHSDKSACNPTFEGKIFDLKDDKDTNGTVGRHVCPYCKLSCAKPSVLQKHIRAHTNERPYPCTPCGFAFKTKSNLYKHRRSRSHALRQQGVEDASIDEEWSLGSEADSVPTNNSRPNSAISSDKLSNPGDFSANDNCVSDLMISDRISPNTSQGDTKTKTIYKPKFHKATLYQEEDETPKTNNSLPPNSEFLNRHISKIISDNEAIVDTLEAPLHRKYIKDLTNHKLPQIIETSTDLSKCNDNQPLNLTKNTEASDSNHRKRCYSESFAQQESNAKAPHQHPLNPERSIIKDLLLKARAQATGLLPVTSETYDASETLYICPLCQIPYRSADNLEIHRLYYCKGNVHPLNGTINLSNRDSLKLPKSDYPYVRSNSVHVTLPETYNPNTLAKLASSTLKSPLIRSNKPENLVIVKNDQLEVAAPLPSPGPLLGNTRLVDSQTYSESRQKMLISHESKSKYRSDSRSSEVFSPLPNFNEDCKRIDLYSPPTKIRCTETPTLRSLEELSLSPMRQNSTSLQMFGGEVKIVDNTGGTTTMRIEPSTSQQSPTMISQSRGSPKSLTQETSSIVVRSGLHSGGTIVHNPPTPKEPLPSPHPQTPRLLVSIAPNISTPNISVAGIPAPNMSKFQFPPIGSITAYNPLTLPPLGSMSPGGATTILHGGKLIPHVPGMPGPNTLTPFSIDIQNYRKTPEPAEPSIMSQNYSIDLSKESDFTFRKDSLFKLKSNNPLQHFNQLNEKNRANAISRNVSKVPIPAIKINSEESSKSKNISEDAKLRINAQNKIDELVRRNKEILQKNLSNTIDVFKSFQKSSEVDLKENNKIVEKKEKSLKEIRQFNFENLISKSEILNKSIENSLPSTSTTNTIFEDAAQERSETSYFKKNITSSAVSSKADNSKPKFLRPNSLPLKPGTFTPKKHHGITPNANTLPLISPETPRPAKAYGQLYLNGHAYTYLGLKCSTKVYYCTLNRPQPTYVPNQHSLSMYSNWQVCSESAPNPLRLTPGQAMSQYDSRHRPQNYSVAKIKQTHRMTHSSQWNASTIKIKTPTSAANETEENKNSSEDLSNGPNKSKSLAGGFESNEEYTYVRGRGRGRYVCSECGIRCKKPSMLKKHIRTHTDVRPFTCKHCAFSFKTKGNLTKHMKSKAHFKKCCELGINLIEDMESVELSQGTGETDDDSESDDEGNEGETESSDTDSWKSRIEHEAAQCLLSLWGGQPAPGLLSTARPSTYPYTPNTTTPSECSRSPDELNMSIKETVIINQPVQYKQEKPKQLNFTSSYPMDLSKPIDLSKDDSRKEERPFYPVSDILTPVGEPGLLASLVQSTAKLPQRSKDWHNDEPMLQAYLTEKALQDSKIKQSQYTNGKIKPHEANKVLSDSMNSNSLVMSENSVLRNHRPYAESPAIILQSPPKNNTNKTFPQTQDTSNMQILVEIATSGLSTTTSTSTSISKPICSVSETFTSTDNAKFVASEYLKVACGKSTMDSSTNDTRNDKQSQHSNSEENGVNDTESEVQKINNEHLGIVRKVVVGAGGVGFKMTTPTTDYSSLASFAKGRLTEDGRSVCVVCNKSFSKPSQLRLHINIHYMERPFRCSACAVSFRTRGHLQKHERSGSHHNKVSMTSTFGAATTTNPRPFKCSDCKIAFRIHGHLAKHLRSKMHVMRLECLGKLPFGTFAEIERAGVSLSDIDTTDCDNSLASLQFLAQKLHEKDPTKLEKWDPTTMAPPLLPPGNVSSDEEDENNSHLYQMNSNDNEMKNNSESEKITDDTNSKFSATDT